DGADLGAPEPVIIAETERPIRTMTVSMAVLEMDLTDSPTIVFRNAAHGGLSVVYRRPDGNIGWIDPERTKSVNGNGSNGATANGPPPGPFWEERASFGYAYWRLPRTWRDRAASQGREQAAGAGGPVRGRGPRPASRRRRDPRGPVRARAGG